jgi:hypothetical protein
MTQEKTVASKTFISSKYMKMLLVILMAFLFSLRLHCRGRQRRVGSSINVVSNQGQGYYVNQRFFASDTLEYITFSDKKARHRHVRLSWTMLKIVR